MRYRSDFRFDANYDLPLIGKTIDTKGGLVYHFDRSCVNHNYSYKISYEAYYKYCYNMALFIARVSGLKDDVTNRLHDYFKFYLSNASFEFPTVRISLSVPDQNEEFVFSFIEKSHRQCYDFESGTYNNNFYDFAYLDIYQNDCHEDLDYIDYSEIEGFDSSDLEYFCKNYYRAYNDYSFILLDDIKANSDSSSKFESSLLTYFGGSVSIISDSKNKIQFKIHDFEFDGDKAFNSAFMSNTEANKLEYIRNFEVSDVRAIITYDKTLNYVKIDDCTYVRCSLTYSDSGLPYMEANNIGKRKALPTTDEDALRILYDAYVVNALKNIVYEIFE